MRGWMVISVLAVAGCGVNQGTNPNYQFGADPYGQYLVAREAALMTNAEPPRTVPVVLPVEAPTPGQIAGRAPVPVPRTMGVNTGRAAKTAAAPAAASTGQAAATGAPIAIVSDDMLPKTDSGPYPGSVSVLTRYAYAADHDPGTAIWGRPKASPAQAARLCAGYPNPDAAQIAFLSAGGPRQDPRGLDPDGDGYVCGWTPEPFRQPEL
ncbi:hypothetical protein [Paracoccus marinaquae]|uniref:Excalibur calcium-binding domain-containing protein n=1 Tax=Paracoccus marinaquae TaxID=2841926 RepID=A0ABS6AGK2_9RHOB|nr:hypothetical protein [Paracoccus marinaquae]MBU3028764.1 hypothetical protein [Paracoccus marinaquae]